MGGPVVTTGDLPVSWVVAGYRPALLSGCSPAVTEKAGSVAVGERENKWNRLYSFVLLGPILVPETLHMEPFQRGLPWTDCEWVHPEFSLIVLLEYFSYPRV